MTSTPIIVAGPTASGKSELAIRLAEVLDGVVINADAMQCYPDLPILTAAPTAGELARAPHRLFGDRSADDPGSVGAWVKAARAEVSAAHSAGKQAILVGGTGLYLKALTQGLAPIPPVPAALREQVEQELQRGGAESLLAELSAPDPQGAARLRPSDVQRVVRAVSVLRASGKPLTYWQAQAGEDGMVARWVIVLPDRDLLYARIDARFEGMVEAGAAAEAKALLARGLDPRLPVMKAVGLRELADFVAGKTSQALAVAAAQQASRRYAKRQMTWLRHQVLNNNITPFVINEPFSEKNLPEILNFIRI